VIGIERSGGELLQTVNQRPPWSSSMRRSVSQSQPRPSTRRLSSSMPRSSSRRSTASTRHRAMTSASVTRREPASNEPTVGLDQPSSMAKSSWRSRRLPGARGHSPLRQHRSPRVTQRHPSAIAPLRCGGSGARERDARPGHAAAFAYGIRADGSDGWVVVERQPAALILGQRGGQGRRRRPVRAGGDDHAAPARSRCELVSCSCGSAR
jgi:hypothetical protein